MLHKVDITLFVDSLKGGHRGSIGWIVFRQPIGRDGGTKGCRIALIVINMMLIDGSPKHDVRMFWMGNPIGAIFVRLYAEEFQVVVVGGEAVAHVEDVMRR